jgi:hypothetical protein
MNFIKNLFVKQELPFAEKLATLNLDKPFDSEKYSKKVIRHLANAIVETNRYYKYQHDVKVVFNCGYNEIDFEARVVTELKSKGYDIINREYKSDTRVLYFSINWGCE